MPRCSTYPLLRTSPLTGAGRKTSKESSLNCMQNARPCSSIGQCPNRSKVKVKVKSRIWSACRCICLTDTILENNHDVFLAILAYDPCQAEGQQLISQFPDMTVGILKMSIAHVRLPQAKHAADDITHSKCGKHFTMEKILFWSIHRFI